MPIFMAEELPDLPDYSAINRAVPQMPSGMQKEEECVSCPKEYQQRLVGRHLDGIRATMRNRLNKNFHLRYQLILLYPIFWKQIYG